MPNSPGYLGFKARQILSVRALWIFGRFPAFNAAVCCVSLLYAKQA
ncbi:hypothetical protein [Acetobacter tropicalis]|nr:hypothetical protein [Acetobacter tropicalis]